MENKCVECPHSELCKKMYPDGIKDGIIEITVIDRIREYYKQPIKGQDISRLEGYIKELDGHIALLRQKVYVQEGDRLVLRQDARPQDVNTYSELSRLRLDLALKLIKEEESNA